MIINLTTDRGVLQTTNHIIATSHVVAGTVRLKIHFFNLVGINVMNNKLVNAI